MEPCECRASFSPQERRDLCTVDDENGHLAVTKPVLIPAA